MKITAEKYLTEQVGRSSRRKKPQTVLTDPGAQFFVGIFTIARVMMILCQHPRINILVIYYRRYDHHHHHNY